MLQRHKKSSIRPLSRLEGDSCFVPIKPEATDFNTPSTRSQLKNIIASLKYNQDQSKKRICFDLNTTLVSSPTIPGDNCTCRRIHRVIHHLQELHADEHYSTIRTARHMCTHNGNVARNSADLDAIMIQQLSDFAIWYDELISGKPSPDLYIHDTAILPFIDDLHNKTGFPL